MIATLRELELPSYPLGVRRDATYPVLRQSLEPGDRLFLLTDGYVEAAGADGEPYGWDRLVSRLGELGETGPDRAVEHLLTELTHHLGSASPQDDVTLIAIAADDHHPEDDPEAAQAAAR